MAKPRHLIYLALLVAQSLALFLFEGLIPLPFLAPGAKLGLANLVTIIALYTLPRLQDTILVLAMRVCLAALFGGGLVTFSYSISGAMLSFIAMAALKKSRRFNVIGISAAGGFCHNAAQLTIACGVMDTCRLWLYLPILGPLGLLTGALLGYTASFIIPRLEKA